MVSYSRSNIMSRHCHGICHFIVALFLSAPATVVVKASCSASNEECKQGSGSCSAAVFSAVVDNDLDTAIFLLKYGKYCGAQQQCVTPEDEVFSLAAKDSKCSVKASKSEKARKLKTGKSPKKVKKGAAPCPAVACDELDSACQMHDACLDTFINEHGEISNTQRCECDVDLVVSQAIRNSGGLLDPTGLCDDGFYNDGVEQFGGATIATVIPNESILIAAPFCCGIAVNSFCAGEGVVDSTKLGVAQTFCTSILDGFADSGLPNICADNPVD